MYFLIISLAFLLAMRGAKPAPLQNPVEGFRRVWREAADLFLTMSLVLALGMSAETFDKAQWVIREYAILIFGIVAYLLSRYQKKTDVFFLSALAGVFMILIKYPGFFDGILWAGIVSAGIAAFQTFFLGLRYKLLFSDVPLSVKGWPVLCLLAGAVALILQGLGSLVF